MLLTKKRIINIICFPIFIKSWRHAVRSYLKAGFVSVEKMYKWQFQQFKERLVVHENAPETFEFKQENAPLVSIVVPVYNQYHYTHLCLWSILQNTPDVPYEIILADDGSTDETQTIGDRIKNIHIVRPDQNLRFLKNCNNAAQYAKGKYILFLNNDTQVQPNWLKPLVDLMESDAKIGMVGSQLLYPDGKLQEAGGIVLQDANGWNYGRNDYPIKGEYNYLKEVDYISGAAIMLKKDLWQELGGFDERFTPAYYEDADLAFQVRQKGLKVVYQPKSKVIHFEGKSNGTDLTSGQKQYQVVNKQKFYDKWKDVLNRENGTTEDIFLARDRSLHKKTLLFIDCSVLTYDQDTGSRAALQYLEFFVKHGLNVKFLAQYRGPQDYHLDKMQQVGAEVICLQDTNDSAFKKWLCANGKYIDYIYLNRPLVAEHYFAKLREYTNAKIIYQGVDLHCARLKEQYELTHDKKILKECQRLEKIEKTLIPQMDVVTFYSDEEIKTMQQWGITKPMDDVPLYLFEAQQMQQYSYNASGRSDIMFIGGYHHHPNVDAALFLVKHVMPSVWEKMPNLKVHLVGSYPPDDVVALASENVIVHGFVSDDELEQLYAKIKLSVIPLRFGAGVKGKVLESVYHKVPVLTTPVGVQGIPDAFCLCVQETPEQLSEKIVALYSDDALLNTMSEKSKQFIEQHYSEKAVFEKFSKWMEVK